MLEFKQLVIETLQQKILAGFVIERRGRGNGGNQRSSLKRWTNIFLNHKIVQRLMKEQGLICHAKMNLILHPDQRWQYQHKTCQKMLKDKGIQQNMS